MDQRKGTGTTRRRGIARMASTAAALAMLAAPGWLFAQAAEVIPPPTSLTGIPTELGIQLSWQDDTAPTNDVYRKESTSDAGSVRIATSVEGDSFLDNDVVDGVRYFYFVVGCVEQPQRQCGFGSPGVSVRANTIGDPGGDPGGGTGGGTGGDTGGGTGGDTGGGDGGADDTRNDLAQNLELVEEDGQIILTWIPPAGSFKFNIYRNDRYVTTLNDGVPQWVVRQPFRPGVDFLQVVSIFGSPGNEVIGDASASVSLLSDSTGGPGECPVDPGSGPLPNGPPVDVYLTGEPPFVELSWVAPDAAVQVNVYRNNAYVTTLNDPAGPYLIDDFVEGDEFYLVSVFGDDPADRSFSGPSEVAMFSDGNGGNGECPTEAEVVLLQAEVDALNEENEALLAEIVELQQGESTIIAELRIELAEAREATAVAEADAAEQRRRKVARRQERDQARAELDECRASQASDAELLTAIEAERDEARQLLAEAEADRDLGREEIALLTGRVARLEDDLALCLAELDGGTDTGDGETDGGEGETDGGDGETDGGDGGTDGGEGETDGGDTGTDGGDTGTDGETDGGTDGDTGGDSPAASGVPRSAG